MKDILVPIDRAGRVVLPKAVRQELAIQPGDVLRVAIQGVAVTLTPKQENTRFVRQGKALVFTTEGDDVLTAGTVEDLLDGMREEHRHSASGAPAGTRAKR